MNANPLAQLKDIDTPSQIGAWPLAWGWWVVIAISAALIVALLVWSIRAYRHRGAKREALALLKTSENMAAKQKVAHINTLLKRVNLAYQARETVAELTGEAWANWLNQHNKKCQIDAELLNLCYRIEVSDEAAHLYYLQVVQWIKKSMPLRPVDQQLSPTLEASRV